jgi:hypothetical protein
MGRPPKLTKHQQREVLVLGARRGEADRDRALLCRQSYDNFANQSAVRSGLAGHVQGISPR